MVRTFTDICTFFNDKHLFTKTILIYCAYLLNLSHNFSRLLHSHWSIRILTMLPDSFT